MNKCFMKDTNNPRKQLIQLVMTNFVCQEMRNFRRNKQSKQDLTQ